MKRFISVVLSIVLILTLATGCGRTSSGISEVKVTIPVSKGSRAIVEGEAVISTQLYLLSRAYFEKLSAYDLDKYNAPDYSNLLGSALEAFRLVEAFSGSFEKHADALAKLEESGHSLQGKSNLQLLSMNTGFSPFITAYAAEKSPALKYAEDITKTFDNAKNGQKLKAIAEKYGTDAKKAKVMLEQAQAIIDGANYQDLADFENKCYQAAVETKAACSTATFVLSAVVSGGSSTLAGGASISGIVEAGGVVFNGVNALIDNGTAITIHCTNGEGNADTLGWEAVSQTVAPISTLFAIGGGVQNIVDFRNPDKALEAVNNAAQALLTGAGIVRDYVQDGTVLGVSSNIIDGYKEIFVRSASTSDAEATKEVLLKTGYTEEEIKSTVDEPQEETLATAADAYIEAMGDIVDPNNPVDIEAVINAIDEEFQKCIDAESIEKIEDTTAEIKTAEAKTENPKKGDALSAKNVAGSYTFTSLEDSSNIDIEYVDDTHLKVTDVGDGESFAGDYDSATGKFQAVLSDSFKWYVYITFTDNNGVIEAELENKIGDNSVISSGAKNK